MNIAYLTQILGTDKLSEVTANIDAPALDMNLAVWDAIDRGEIAVDEENDTIAVLEAVPSSDPELKDKILRVIQHYARNGTNVTRGRLNGYVKDTVTGNGYPWHEYLMAVQHLIDGGLVVQDVIDVPQSVRKFKDKKGRNKQTVLRPAHKFAFLCLADNHELNAEWNAEAVNKWIAGFEENQ